MTPKTREERGEGRGYVAFLNGSYPFNKLMTRELDARRIALECAEDSDSPCGIWARDGWFALCDSAPDDEFLTDNGRRPEEDGWIFYATAMPAMFGRNAVIQLEA